MAVGSFDTGQPGDVRKVLIRASTLGEVDFPQGDPQHRRPGLCLRQLRKMMSSSAKEPEPADLLFVSRPGWLGAKVSLGRAGARRPEVSVLIAVPLHTVPRRNVPSCPITSSVFLAIAGVPCSQGLGFVQPSLSGANPWWHSYCLR